LENLLVDTNVLIYETFEDSEHHVDATDILVWEHADTVIQLIACLMLKWV